MRKIGDRLDAEIPPAEAAYRKYISTMEHVFATKMILERAISAKNERPNFLLLHMTETFDSINRKLLIEDLKNIIDYDELHLIKIVLNLKLSVKYGCNTSEYLNIDTGAPQGDCTSANELFYYLVKSLASIRKSTPTNN